MVLARLSDRTAFFVGLSVGIAISLIVLPILEDRCFSSRDRPRRTHVPAAQRSPLSDDFEPIINLQGGSDFIRARETKYQQQLRPRYYSSELGIREKLLIAVLSTSVTFQTHAVFQNRTLSGEIKSVRFFVELENASQGKDFVSIQGVDALPPIGDQHFSLSVLEIIAQKYVKDFDFVLLVQDSTYVYISNLLQLIQSFSVSYKIHMGGAPDNDPNSAHCSLNGGILLSHSLVRQTVANLQVSRQSGYEICSGSTLSSCVYRVTKTPCQQKIQGKTFSTQEILVTRPLPDWPSILNSTSLHPILEGEHFLRLHEFICENRLKKLYLDTVDIRKSQPWPLGLEPPFKPTNRFHVLTWTYFNRSHYLSVDNEQPAETFVGRPQYVDLQDAIRSCENWQAVQDPQIVLLELVNGYKRFDATRGVEYVLDFRTNSREAFKRFMLFRPLSRSEMLPVPYVTEHTRVIILMPVTAKEVPDAILFLANYESTCLDKQENSALVLILLYNATDPGKDSENDVFKELKTVSLNYANKYRSTGAKLVWYSIRTLKTGLSEFAVLDLVIHKLPVNSLILICQLGTIIEADYLNRVRMNTISKSQSYFPIPFVQYNPSITDISSVEGLEVKKEYGFFDNKDFRHNSFYISDYISSRGLVEKEVPIVKVERDLRQTVYYDNPVSLLSMFLKTKTLNILRSVEPQLKIVYRHPLEFSENCVKTMKRTLGAKSHLAKVILLEELKKIKTGS